MLYFIIGAVILKVKYQRAGSEIIPNKGFWFALPILIKVSPANIIHAVWCVCGDPVGSKLAIVPRFGKNNM